MLAIIFALSILPLAVSQNWNFAGVNIALDKNATQLPDSDDFPATLAVDGNVSSCSSTNTSIQTAVAKWTVYFAGNYVLKGIRIYSSESAQNRLANISVTGGQVPLYPDGASDNTVFNETRMDITITPNSSFSEITIQIPDNENSGQSLCEVEVYSVTNDCDITLIHENVSWEISNGTGFTNADMSFVSSGSVLEFECLDGFGLVGAMELTCLSDGSFDGESPTCALRCEQPQNISNGKYLDANTTFVVGDQIFLHCDMGYTPEGNNSRECLTNGTWSGQEPMCSIVVCPFPNNGTNFNLTFSNGTEYKLGDVGFGTMANVTCEEGFEPRVKTIECNATGHWDNNPECLEVECNSLGNVTGGLYVYMLNGTVVPDGNIHVYGTQAVLLCNDTLYRKQSEESGALQCSQQGSWNGSPGECIAQCELPDLGNGFYNAGGMPANNSLYDAGQSLTPECNERFKLNESSQERICQPNHNWNGSDPDCILITCPVPRPPTSGALTLAGSDFLGNKTEVDIDTSITVVCYEGFEPNKSTITCTKTGEWNSLPECIQIRCESLGPLRNGEYEYTLNGSVVPSNETFIYGTTAKATCNGPLFKLNVGNNRTCRQDRSWSGQEIMCIPRCPIPTLDHGKFISDSDSSDYYDKGQSVSVTCNLGYELGNWDPNDRSWTCQDDHTWTKENPTCNIVNCLVKDFRRQQNFYSIVGNISSVEFNKSVTANCLEGYEHSGGSSVRTCLPNKTFSGEELRCVEISSPASLVGPAAGGTVAALVVIAIVGVLVYMFVIRKRKGHDPGSHIKVEYKQGLDNVTSVGFSRLEDIETGITNPNYELPEVQTRNEVPKYEGRPRSVMDMNALVDFILTTDFRDQCYTNEFESFKKGPQKPHEAALANPTKNRFENILPYDESRVKLDVWDPETETDYINASFIVGYTDPNAYIACQGPTEDTFNDFWRMVWQQNSEVMIMLTQLVEDGKVQCGQYWPSEGSKAYGKVTVTLLSEEHFAHFVTRKFSLNKEGDDDRMVEQFQFTSWPENACPSVCMRILNFTNKAKNEEMAHRGPLIIHCSAGVGRTGTFIAIDYLSEQSMEEGTVVVADYVRNMRDLRPDMVQTKDQYLFIHRALVESFLLNTFDVASDDFSEVYASLLANEPMCGKPKIDVDFDNLQKISAKAPTGETKHMDKNRKPDHIPSTEYMPSIEKPGLTNGGDDYINAVFISTYKNQNGMIITQSPLESTREDFWKLVYQQKVTTIVMMNHASELDEKEVYWPLKDETIAFGEHAITHKGAEEKSGHTVLSLSLKRNDEERDVTLIQFGTWEAGKPTPAERKDMLSVLKLVAEKQPVGSNSPVLVHCMDGAEKSGLFCVTYFVMEREKIETTVAIPLAIQEVRSRRTQTIPNVEQFRFCYEVVLEYLKTKKTSSFK